ncbi:MAG: hypothetical protein RLZZ69_1520 [Cyanobacteriota bacterium]
MAYIPTHNLVIEQMSVKELQTSLEAQQDNANRASISTARLIELTYNMNRGSASDPTLSDIAPYLPYPHRYMQASQLALIHDISKEACIDFLSYYDEIPTKIKIRFEDYVIGIQAKARS